MKTPRGPEAQLSWSIYKSQRVTPHCIQTYTRTVMKVGVSDEEWKVLDSIVWRGALEGAFASAAVAIPGFYYLHRKSAWYRSLTLPLRVAGVVLIVVPFTSIQAERRSLQYERTHWCVHIRVSFHLSKVRLTRSCQVGFRKARAGSCRGGRRGPV